MIVKGHNVDLPEEFVLRAMVDGDREITSIVETTELRGWNGTSIRSACSWLLYAWLFFWLEQ